MYYSFLASEVESSIPSSPLSSADYGNNLTQMLEDAETNSDIVSVPVKYMKDSVEFLNNVKALYNRNDCTRMQKLQILTLIPESWSTIDIMKHFDTNRRMISVARQNLQDHGLLATPNPKRG